VFALTLPKVPSSFLLSIIPSFFPCVPLFFTSFYCVFHITLDFFSNLFELSYPPWHTPDFLNQQPINLSHFFFFFPNFNFCPLKPLTLIQMAPPVPLFPCLFNRVHRYTLPQTLLPPYLPIVVPSPSNTLFSFFPFISFTLPSPLVSREP